MSTDGFVSVPCAHRRRVIEGAYSNFLCVSERVHRLCLRFLRSMSVLSRRLTQRAIVGIPGHELSTSWKCKLLIDI